MAGPDPAYDLAGALQALLPGVVVQRSLVDAAAAQYAANGYTPLTQAQALACLTAANALDQPDMAVAGPAFDDPTTATPYPATPPGTIPLPNGTFEGTANLYPVPAVLMTLPRFPDSNPEPRDLLSSTGADPRVVGG